jgi:replication factor C subunit 1
MSNNWIDKYSPKDIKDIIGNNNNILKINYFLKEFKRQQNSSILISGNHGVGKGMITKLILEKNNYYYKWLGYKDEKNKDILDDIQNGITGENIRQHYVKDEKQFALVIDDIEKITLKSEKKRVLELVKNNSIEKLFPIIFISNLQHNKLLTDILVNSEEYKIYGPKNNELLTLLERIIDKEDIKLEDSKCKLQIIKFAQNDIRRLISVLYDIKNSFGNNILNKSDLKRYLSTSMKKNKDISLFDATKILIDEYKNINYCIDLYKVDKVLVPLTIHENFYKSLIGRYNDNSKILNTMKYVTDSISKGDVIETNIYTDQNWFLHDIHGFFTCAKTSYNINKHKPKYNTDAIPYYNLSFSSDLNQTSLKNINKKQITNLQAFFPDKSFKDIICMNKIIYNLMKEDKIEDVYNIINYYDKNIKTVETFIKIDKSLPRIAISQKNKKKFNLLCKN